MNTGNPNSGNLSGEQLQIVSTLSETFEAARRAKTETPTLECLVLSVDESLREVLLEQLLRIDLSYLDSHNFEAEKESLKERFPEYDTVVDRVAESFADLGETHLFDHGSARCSAFSLNTPSVGPEVISSDDPVGKDFGDYELLEEIARGGMGVVYKARQRGLNRTVALKMIRSGGLAGPEEIQRFHLEAEAAAKLDHPAIVPVYEVGERGGQHYYSMRFVEGESLASAIEDHALTPRNAALLLHSVCDAMAFAHREGVLHRDLKPANIILESRATSSAASTRRSVSSLRVRADGVSDFRQPLITDFGLARASWGESELTSTGQVLGTPSYMPPEQARGETVGPEADIYSAGAVLYASLTGNPPFKGASVMETLQQVLSQEPVSPRQLNPSVDVDLETICLKCLEKSAERRYPTMSELRDDLDRWLDGKPIVARPITLAERSLRWCRRNPAFASLGSIIVVLLVAGTIISSMTAFYMKRLRDEALEQTKKATAAKEKADDLAKESRASLIGLTIATGMNYADAGDHQAAALFYTRAWTEDKDEARDPETHRLRIAAALSKLPTQVGFVVHPQGIREARFHDAGKMLLVRDLSSVARVWNPFTGDQLAVLDHGGGSRLTDVGFSRDGQVAITCGGNSAKIWSCESWKLLRELSHPDRVWMADFDPSGLRLVTACEDGAVRTWNYATGESLSPELDCSTGVTSVQFSPKGDRVVTTDKSGEGTVWEYPSGKQLTEDLPIQIFISRNRQKELRNPPVFYDDGRKMMAYGEGRLRIWETLEWEEIDGLPITASSKGPYLGGFSVTQKGDQVLLGTHLAYGQLFRVAEGKLDPEYASLPTPRQTQQVALSGDGLFAAVASGHNLYVWRTSDAVLLGTIRHADVMSQIEFTKTEEDEILLLSASLDGTVRICRIDSQ